ncbi:MAG: DUF2177 family protein [Candidatus Babeliales bacterium]
MISWHVLKVLGLGYSAFVLIDLFWLGFLMRDFYATQLGSQLRIVNGALAPQWPAALIVWFLLVLGLYIFVLPKATTIFSAAFYGALFGIIVYGVYDLSNYATLSDWPFIVVIFDLLWGACINSLIAMLMFFL